MFSRELIVVLVYLISCGLCDGPEDGAKWNSRGYDFAKEFANMYSLVSPVWAQVRPDFKITGLHDHDAGWIRDVKTVNEKVKIVPRILFDGWSDINFADLFNNETLTDKCIKAMVDAYTEHQYDGVVVEIWSQHSGTSQLDLVDFIKKMSASFHRKNMVFVLVVPPPLYQYDYPGRFNKQLFDLLVPDVDFFSVMTYDFPMYGTPGPNSPLDWVSKCVTSLVPDAGDPNRSKLLMGTNFYGYQYGVADNSISPIVADNMVELVRKHKPTFVWLKQAAEHSFEVENKFSVYYPTALSVARRVSLSEELGVGLSIWEIGQGLRCFFDLL